jgi:hypothetical protein
MIDLENLRYDAVGATPVDADWSELGYDPDGETGFDFREAHRCENDHTLEGLWEAAHELDLDAENILIPEELDRLLVTTESECPVCSAEHHQEGPMMNYYYPVDLDDLDEAAKLIVDTPLCAVNVHGQTGLALTGGGMDLSWEICEAFLLLGFAPPAHFAGNLPRMSGRGKSRLDKKILQGCVKSLEAVSHRAAHGLEDVKRMLEEDGC